LVEIVKLTKISYKVIGRKLSKGVKEVISWSIRRHSRVEVDMS